MCNQVYVSTTSTEDLSLLEPSLARFRKSPYSGDRTYLKRLRYASKWFLTTVHGGCSCHFNHLMWPEPTFGPQEEWWEPDPDNVKATQEAYVTICRLVGEGHRVELLDTWNDDFDDLEFKVVSVSEVPTSHFRLFENYHFDFVP